MNEAPDFESLVNRYADGLATEKDVVRLNECLRNDAGARREFVELLNLDSALAAVAADSSAERRVIAFPRVLRGLAAAACVTLLAGGAW